MFWIVLCEVLVMFALFVVSWRVYQAHRPVASAGAVGSAGAGDDDAGKIAMHGGTARWA